MMKVALTICHKPRDKAKGEVGAQVVERSHHRFFSLLFLNIAVRELLGDLNNLHSSECSVLIALSSTSLTHLCWCHFRYSLTITDEEVKEVQSRLNSRPRKTLGYRTPHQVFYKQSPVALQC